MPPRERNYVSVIIAAGETKSTVIDIGLFAGIGLVLPTLDNCELTFEISGDELNRTGVWYPLKDKDGNTVVIDAGEGERAISYDDLTPVTPFRFIRLVSSVTQTEERTIKVALKS